MHCKPVLRLLICFNDYFEQYKVECDQLIYIYIQNYYFNYKF